ncbi:hypothetical protein GCM10007147_15120 [Nocardiopsis kunsanensis]|uniref:Uncharacterized protein n=1 Tax=Nocardiopsis kunsanensis TaxID=141693 RepID=A0A919CHC2_9ACTN|nr:hypothetical protein GCM10007147_15120 [Nocardiopsis kunsanensis]
MKKPRRRVAARPGAMADLNGQIDMQTLLAAPREHSFAHAPVRVVPGIRTSARPTTRSPRSRSRRIRRYAADLPPARSLALVAVSPAAAYWVPEPEGVAQTLMFESPDGVSGRPPNGPRKKIFCAREGEVSE